MPQAQQPHAIISGKDLLMMSIVRFYKENNNQNMYRIIPIIEGKSKISLRLIDWFVTNYSKKYNIIIPKKNASSLQETNYLNVYISYRQQLKAFSKQQFDPFRRRDRIKFFYDKDNNWIETTIGQLNFFKWILQNNILNYIQDNLHVIEADMVSSQKINTNTNTSTNTNATITSSTSSQQTQSSKKTKKVLNTIQPKNKNEIKVSTNSKNAMEKKDKRKKKQIGSSASAALSRIVLNPVVGPKLVKFD